MVKYSFAFKTLVLFIPFYLITLFATNQNIHPIYVSVTDIEYNAQEKQLEISCRMFTGDFENALKKTHPQKIDLLKPSMHKEMESLVFQYIRAHVRIKQKEKDIPLSFLGYEQDGDGIECFLYSNVEQAPSSMVIFNDLFYEINKKQTNIIHLKIEKKRASTKLNNPENKFDWNQ